MESGLKEVIRLEEDKVLEEIKAAAKKKKRQEKLEDSAVQTEAKADPDAHAQSEGRNEDLKKRLELKEKEAQEYFELLQRTMADFENYKKRTQKEKAAVYSMAVSDIMTSFLPVLDAFEMAGKQEEGLSEGMQLVCRQFQDVLKSFAVEEIKTLGERFNPQLHEAVMHVEDEKYGEHEIVEEMRKGYRLKDKVIRHSMVKVAN